MYFGFFGSQACLQILTLLEDSELNIREKELTSSLVYSIYSEETAYATQLAGNDELAFEMMEQLLDADSISNNERNYLYRKRLNSLENLGRWDALFDDVYCNIKDSSTGNTLIFFSILVFF